MTVPASLRADAQRNRAKLVATAREAFAEYGLDASLDEIAKRAGLGSGTLYRHFPTRDDLITAVFLERTAENLAAVERALEQDDPWESFADYVRQTCRMQASDRALADLMAIGHHTRELRVLRMRAFNGVTALVDRAKASGALRPDYTPEDLLLLLMANAGVICRAGAAATAASERFVAFALDGLHAEAATPAPASVLPAALTAAQRC